jgi:hypothetical protein
VSRAKSVAVWPIVLIIAFQLLTFHIPAVFAAPVWALGGHDVVCELEEGDLGNGTAAAASPITGFSGSGYVTGFASKGDSVSINVTAPSSGVYGFTVRSALYLKDAARGKPHAYSHVGSRGDQSITDGSWTNARYWASGVPSYVGEPRWVQVDLVEPARIAMARIRIPATWGSRTQTFSLWGGVDEDNLIELAPSKVYQFERNTSAPGLGNFVDIEFSEPVSLRYARAVFTGRSDTGADGYQVSNFELYPTSRTAELYVDGLKATEFNMSPQKIISPSDIAASGTASFDPGVPSWVEDPSGGVLLTAGAHTLSVVSGGAFPGEYNIDAVSFSAPQEMDPGVLAVINAIDALPAADCLRLGDKPAVAAARAAYDALDEAQRNLIFTYWKLAEAEARLSYLEAESDDRRPPVIGGLSVGDAVNGALWTVKENLQFGDIAYGDASAAFTAVPDDLKGAAWVSPALASNAWNGAGTLCSFTVNRDGWLYIAAIGAPAWLADYESAQEQISVGGESYHLYRKPVEAGAVLRLPAQGDARLLYIPIVKTATLSAPPDKPSISRFAPPFDTAGWYTQRTDLGPGSPLFTDDAALVTEAPQRYRGADYIQTYNGARSGISFYAERNIEVAVTLDTRASALPQWLSTWENTGLTLSATGGRSYRLYSKEYRAGEFITIPSLPTNVPDNCIIIAKPSAGGEQRTENPLAPLGEDRWDSDLGYRYYANDVFNQDGALPLSYSLKSGSASIVSNNAAEPADLAFRRIYTTSDASSAQFMNATDGLDASYWQSDAPSSWISVSLGRVKRVNVVEVRLPAAMSARGQTFGIEGAANGSDYKTLTPPQAYAFNPSSGNTVKIALAEPADVDHVRLSFSGGTACVGEFRVFGDETTGVDKYIALSSESGASLEKDFGQPIDGRAIFEFKVKPSREDNAAAVRLTGASDAVAVMLTFSADGSLYANDGGSQTKILPYRADTWYTVKIAADLNAGVYDLWVNQLRKAESLAAAAPGGVRKLAFSAEGEGSLSIDNVKAYDDTEEYLFEESFGAADFVPDGWLFTNPRAAGVADVPFASDKSLALTADGSAAKATRRIPETSGVVSFETKVKLSNAGFAAAPVITDDQNRVAAAVAFYRNNLYAVNGDNWIKIIDGESPWAYYPADNWYLIKITLNTYTNRYDLYVDGASRMKGLSFVQDVDSVSRVAYTLIDDNVCYVNSLSAYKGFDLGGGLIDKERVLNVKDAPYNAKGDGMTDDTEAIQAALDDAAFTGRTVLVDGGAFLTSTLSVRSDTTLYVSQTASILGVQDKNNYPLIETCEGLVNHAQIGRGLVFTENASNVRIEGGGVIDGNGLYGYKVNDPPQNQRLQLARPCVILSVLSHDVTIQNVSLIRSAFWTLVPMESENVAIRNVNVNSINNTPNRDGIDPVDVVNLTIENCNILAGDDGLCFKTSSFHGNRNVDVCGVRIMALSNGIKFGTDTYYEWKNITISDVTMKNVVKAGIAIEATDGAEVDGVTFARVDMSDVDAPVYMTVGNRGRQPTSRPGMRIGWIRNVAFTDVNFFNAKEAPYSFEADTHENVLIGLDNDTHRIQNIAFRNVTMEMPGGAAAVPGWPSGTLNGYPEHYNVDGKPNAWAYCIRYADNVTFSNVTNILLNGDARPEISYGDYGASPIEFARPVTYVRAVYLRAALGTPANRLNLPETVQVIADYDLTASVPVSWRPEGTYNPNAAGVYAFTGALGESPGVANGGDLAAVAYVRVVEGDSPIPAPPSNVSASVSGSANPSQAITISWTASSSEDVAAYSVYAGMTPDFDLESAVFCGRTPDLSLVYLPGSRQALYFKVCALSSLSAASEPSAVSNLVVGGIDPQPAPDIVLLNTDIRGYEVKSVTVSAVDKADVGAAAMAVFARYAENGRMTAVSSVPFSLNGASQTLDLTLHRPLGFEARDLVKVYFLNAETFVPLADALKLKTPVPGDANPDLPEDGSTLQIEAENFAYSTGSVSVADAPAGNTATSGGRQVEGVDQADALTYIVDVPETGYYNVYVRFTSAANAGDTGGIRVTAGGVDYDLRNFSRPYNNSDWNGNYQSLRFCVWLESGLAQPLTITNVGRDSSSAMSINIDRVDIQKFVPTVIPTDGSPARIEAENFMSKNSALRVINDHAPGFESNTWYASAILAGDTVTYRIEIAEAGAYNFAVALASQNNSMQYRLDCAGQSAVSEVVERTSSWTAYREESVRLDLPAGVWLLTFTDTYSRYNYDYIDVSKVDNAP